MGVVDTSRAVSDCSVRKELHFALFVPFFVSSYNYCSAILTLQMNILCWGKMYVLNYALAYQNFGS